MSTTVSTQLVPALETIGKRHSVSSQGRSFGLITTLTALALLIHGYHPYSEDGGLYVTGIKHLLSPSLYPHNAAFVDAHLRYSIFFGVIATLVRLTHLGLPIVLLAIHFACIWATLYSVLLLTERCRASRFAPAGAVLLMAAWLTVPIAGTSIILMDPYLTARSISLPCTLFALTAVIDAMRAAAPAARNKAILLAAIALSIASTVHPLMAAYGLGDVLILACLLARSSSIRRYVTSVLLLASIAFAWILQSFAPTEPVGYLRVAASRYYWFLSQWQWYEVVGLAAPLLIFAVVLKLRAGTNRASSALIRMAFLVGCTSIAVAVLFAHESSATHLVARLQPLRAFQTIYVVMILYLGAVLGEYVLKSKIWRHAAALILLGGVMFAVQRATYPASNHLEVPGLSPANAWQQAFVWIGQHTPQSALFAMDSNYISLPGEDAQSFRAMAERSALPDFSKDGGEASITPGLTGAWTIGEQAQRGLSGRSDRERVAQLRPLNVDWVLLQQGATTSFECPYRNGAVKVCRLP